LYIHATRKSEGTGVIEAAIVGASGYSGAELLRLLTHREGVHIRKVIASASVGQRVDTVYPTFSGRLELAYEPWDAAACAECDLVFVAVPSGESMNIVPELLQSGPRVIDLSGDFRLQTADQYERYYKHTHTAPQLLGEAAYGLPELHRPEIATARLVANPGCYPTSAILGLLPALEDKLIDPTGIVITAMSGVSGAGRSATLELSFTEVNENMRAYKIGNHQHIPEIQTVLSRVASTDVSLSFIPHLVPLTRGLYTTIHARLDVPLSTDELYEVFRQRYHEEPFVRVKRQIPQVKDVVHTNYCDIFVHVNSTARQAIIVSVIDNLVKGASGQAVQNMNIMFGLPENEGLL
jgi:N-acetyl-gamma-glutamyl-phosphate reductase